MKITRLLAYITLLFNQPIHAQVITDGSMGAVKHLSANIAIPQNLGTTAGNNLFHSFKSFDINKGESVTFTGADNLKNVISRVTGNEISHINGLLKSEIKNANFYFINPAGIFFGEGAKVDVPAAFYVSTSDSLNFKDNSVFNLETKTSRLSVAQPSDFGFLNNHAGDIVIQNTGEYKSEFDKNSNYLGTHCHGDCFSFINGNTVLLNANHINLEKGILLNYAGSVTLNANDINLSNHSSIDTSTDNNHNAGNISMNAINIALKSSNLFSNANKNSSGNAGIFNLQAVHSFSIDAEGISGNAGIFGRTYSIGHAGTAILKSDNIISKNGAVLSVSTLGKGRGGDVYLQAKELIIDNGSISSNANAAALGSAGNIDVNSDKITIENEGFINSTTFGVGHAGTVNVQAKELILNNGSIYSNARANGYAGAITVSSDDIIIENGGKINSSSYGKGHAGNVSVLADNIKIEGSSLNSDKLTLKYSNISALASNTSTASAGNVTVRANNNISLNNGAYISVENDTNVNNPQLIEESIVSVSAKDITLNKHSSITARSTGNMNAGQINITFLHKLMLNNNAKIDSEAYGGNGGHLIIKGGELINLQNSNIETYTESPSNDNIFKGGDIYINANVLMMNTAQILSREGDKIGGFADLNLKALITSQNQLQINGKTLGSFESLAIPFNIIRTANSGWTTPQLNIMGSISSLNRNTLDLPNLNRDSCDNSSPESSLARQGKGGNIIKENQFIVVPFNFELNKLIKQEFQVNNSLNLLATTLNLESYPCTTLSH